MSTNYNPVIVIGLPLSEITHENIYELIDNETVNVYHEQDDDPDPIVGFALYKGSQEIVDNGLIVFGIEKIKDTFRNVLAQEPKIHLTLSFY